MTDENIPEFYKSIHNLFMKYVNIPPSSINEIINQSIWFNKYILLNKQTLFFKNWYKQGIHTIHDIINKGGLLLSHAELKEKYNINTSFIHTLQILKSIPKTWLQQISHKTIPKQTNIDTLYIKINKNYIPFTKTKCKDFYWHLINLNTHIPNCIYY
jgi:hypothetical protein